MQVINQAETEVKLYRTDELIPGRSYIVNKSPVNPELVGRVVIATIEKIHTNGKIIVGVDNEGYTWFQQDTESYGYLLQKVNAEIHIKELL
jgi:hypothetical protein